ncbi:MAG: glycosyltransferase family 2 protein [Clostridia bacterium]|nr:glycosyltransferase family 2 protein [Clostridia bacterium]
MKLSLVVPCYNEQDNVELFYNVAVSAFSDGGFDYELIFVNDGSKDATMQRLRDLYNKAESNIKVIGFSRNFGKESAMYAGLKESVGDYVCIIDADLQQRPELVLDMLKILEENPDCDSVACYQEDRRESEVLAAFKNCFYKIINKLSEIEFVSGASDFRLLRRAVVDAVLSMSEYHRFSKGIFSWVGFNTYYMPYVVEDRANGTTNWSFWKLFKYAIDGILAFTTIPLRLATFIGLFSSAASIIYMIVVIIQKLAFSIDVPGYATIVVLILLLGGLQLFCIGVLGEYLSKTYVESKRRPIYIAKEILDYKTRDKD